MITPTVPELPKILVPSKREAFVALDLIRKLTIKHHPQDVVDGVLITWDDAMESLRRFILTH